MRPCNKVPCCTRNHVTRGTSREVTCTPKEVGLCCADASSGAAQGKGVGRGEGQRGGLGTGYCRHAEPPVQRCSGAAAAKRQVPSAAEPRGALRVVQPRLSGPGWAASIARAKPGRWRATRLALASSPFGSATSSLGQPASIVGIKIFQKKYCLKKFLGNLSYISSKFFFIKVRVKTYEIFHKNRKIFCVFRKAFQHFDP